MILRVVFTRRALAREGDDRNRERLYSRLVPIAVLEAGCLISLMMWMLNGTAVPGLVVAGVLLALAIAFVPISDPDAA